MGQSESVEGDESAFIPGFNPEIITQKKNKEAQSIDNKTPLNSSQNENEDTFLKYANITDAIRPIYEAEASQVTNDAKDVTFMNASVNDILKELLNTSKENETDDDKNLRDFDSMEREISEEKSTSDSDECVEDRGMYHYEQKNEQESVSIISSMAHPIFVQGDCCIGESLKVRDGSPWAQQYPIFSVSWFVGMEIANSILFSIKPDNTGWTLAIQPEMFGKYLQVKAYRRVEDQRANWSNTNEEKGVYDPHVGHVKMIQTGIEKHLVDVLSSTTIGPVLISDEMAYNVLRSLNEGHMKCLMELNEKSLQTVSTYSLYEKSNETHKSFKDHRENTFNCKGKLYINFKRLSMKYSLSKDLQNSKLYEKDLYHFLRSIQEYFFGSVSKKLNSTEDSQKITIKLKLNKLKAVTGIGKHELILKRFVDKMPSGESRQSGCNSIRLYTEPDNKRDILLYTIYAFQAASYFGENSKGSWNESMKTGDVGKVKDMIQKYFEVIRSNVENGVNF
ncbi:uncharacterized protein LOC128884028 isoform X2 [Hylaeus volcanicus]|uniref:uncharacterized protein LOC128884028 isoform X2 n=1 Tax=Hylaeus volcanicus TaxID=313075 RepID=UPI0023B7DCD3|nr:uncharacterized protein LOC128884028 isoform X2 [Hylaeus volcanicus]